MKIDGLGRCHLKGCEGDATNVTLSAVGHNKATYVQRQGSAGAAPTVQTEAAYQGLRPRQGPRTDLP